MCVCVCVCVHEYKNMEKTIYSNDIICSCMDNMPFLDVSGSF